MARNLMLYLAGFVVCVEGLDRMGYSSLTVGALELILGGAAVITSLTWEEW